MTGPTPFLDFFKRGEVAREVRLLAAQGALAPRAQEQLAMLVVLLADPDAEIRATAEATLKSIPAGTLKTLLGSADLPVGVREWLAASGVPADNERELVSDAVAALELELTTADAPAEPAEEAIQSVVQRLAEMSITDRLKAAMKGTREMRAILIRDPDKMVAAAVLSSPKLTQAEVESFARMANVSEDVLRTIAANRAWLKSYGVVLALTRNPKTPVAMSMNMMARLTNRDLATLSVDRNVPDSLRIAARQKASTQSR